MSTRPPATPTKDRRVPRACVACRQRKTRCDLCVASPNDPPVFAYVPLTARYSHGTPGVPPCTRCLHEHLECRLATSRRGGRRTRTRAASVADAAAPPADIDGDLASRDLLNPSDALNILAQVADLDGDHEHAASTSASAAAPSSRRPSQAPRGRGGAGGASDGNSNRSTAVHDDGRPGAAMAYPPVADGILSLADAETLLSRYAARSPVALPRCCRAFSR